MINPKWKFRLKLPLRIFNFTHKLLRFRVVKWFHNIYHFYLKCIWKNNDCILMFLKITLYCLFVPEEGSSHSRRIHKCQCANILCYNIRLHFSSFLCSLDLFLTPFASFPKSIIVDMGEKQLKLFSRPHEQMLGATVHWFSQKALKSEGPCGLRPKKALSIWI